MKISTRLRALGSTLLRDLKWDLSGIAMSIPSYGQKLSSRTLYTEVGGVSGHVSDFDTQLAKEQNLRPLNRFEKWLMGPRIESQKATNWERFRKAMIDVTGEDPAAPYGGCVYIDFEEDDSFSNMANAILTERFAHVMLRN